MPESAPFARVAEAFREIAALAGRHAKADRLGVLLDGLDDDDLARVVRWASGRVFPLADGRTVGIGGAALLASTAEASGAEADTLRAALVRLGDAGDVAAEALAGRPSAGWTLDRVEHVFETLAATAGSRARTALVAEALHALAPDEARLFVRLLAGDLRIGLLEGGVESALARLYARPLAHVQRAHMLTGSLGRAAVLARHDRLADARFEPFHPVRFMLATAAEASATRTLAEEVERQMAPPFAVEDKFDGIRAQAHVAPERPQPAEPGVENAAPHGVVHATDGGPVRVALFSRTLDGIASSFPDLVAPLATLAGAPPGGLVLDGEIVPLDPATGRIAPFQTLQGRLGRKRVTDAMQREAPVGFVAYDVLAWDGHPLFDAPLAERLAALDRLGLPSSRDAIAGVARSHVDTADAAGALDAMFDAARARGNEGLMVKRLDAPYTPGRRGRDWLKVKKALATLDAVVTAVEVGSGGRRHLLSDFTFAVRADDGALLNVGKAYSGLTDAELAELTDWFKTHTLQEFAHGRVRTVEPQIVVEVAFDRVQASARHKSGFALRFPRIVRWRRDKPAVEIDTLATVAALADGGA